MKSSILTVVSLLVLAGVLGWMTLGAQKVQCEVCIEFKGRRNCATAAAETRADAIRSGTSTACGLLAAGVRDSFACDATSPASVTCQ